MRLSFRAPRWGTVTTAREPTPLLLAFVAHYLAAGAHEMWIYLEAPDPAFEQALRGHPKVRIVATDPAQWPALHRAPRSSMLDERQNLNTAHAHANTGCDWLLHCDVDEFLTRPRDLRRFLAGLRREAAVVKLRNVERVYPAGPAPGSIYAGLFRQPLVGPDLTAQDRIYGDGARFLHRGLAGHSFGKCLTRVGVGATVRVHDSDLPPELDPARAKTVFPGFGLAHFDGLTAAHWNRKMTGKFDKTGTRTQTRLHPGRFAQFEAAHEAAGNPKAAEQLFQRIHGLSAEQAAELRAMKRLVPVVLEVDAALARVFPGLRVDHSPAGIDRAFTEFEARLAGGPPAR